MDDLEPGVVPEGNAGADPLAPDAATRHVRADAPSADVALIGYLGEGDSDQERRLYEDVSFRRYVSFEVDDIVDRVSSAGEDDLTAGQSVVLVRRDAVVLWCESVSASSFETSSRPGPSLDAPGRPGGRRWPRL